METVKIIEVTSHLERRAPTNLQESYDNSGLITGNPEWEITGVLVTLDCIEAVVDEAIKKKCNLIVAHHPIVFKGLKKLTGTNYVERTIIKAIKNDIAIYAIHTNLDNVLHGVNGVIAKRLGLADQEILSPKPETLLKLVTFVPQTSAEAVAAALHKAGAGHIGNYTNCSFQSLGTGTFKPSKDAQPYTGSPEELERTEEIRLEVILQSHQKRAVVSALMASHPYEEVAYFLSKLENTDAQVGAGIIGSLPEPLEPMAFLQRLKSNMNTECIRYTALQSRKISRVAVCGGAGSFLLGAALAAKADAFVSSDFKYHEFFDAEGKILIADVGHYESEQFTKELLKEDLELKFPNFATSLSNLNTNPISYL